jgi:hypothetical protein
MKRSTTVLATIALGAMLATGSATASMARGGGHGGHAAARIHRGGHGFGHAARFHGRGFHGFRGHRGWGGYGGYGGYYGGDYCGYPYPGILGFVPYCG